MQFPSHTRSFTELRENMDAYGITAALQEQFTRCVNFHTVTSPGLFIGVFMVDYALELLDYQQGEKLYAVTETYKCIPDPVQVIAGCTYGNHRLQVLPIGKFALTMNRPSKKKVVTGVRVYVDTSKLKKYPIINAWYTHSTWFDSSDKVYPLIDQILTAGRNILSSQKVEVTVPQKESWKSVPCSSCGEMVPDVTLEENHCRGCGSMSYYSVVSGK